jgi:hypothetical protein
MGDFNFYLFAESRNRDGANMQDTFIFNEVISHLGLVELPIKGRSYTWSNMQQNPLLVQLDWFFTSTSWTLNFPNTVVNPLAKPVSDHISCVIDIGTKIPKASIFRFENFWVRQPGFMDVVQRIWDMTNVSGNSAKVITSKLKFFRKALKKWNGNISNMDAMIANCNKIILMVDEIEEVRSLHISEWNFRKKIKERYQHLTACKKDIWKSRCTIRWATMGDENTAFFHAMATVQYRKNSIARFTLPDGREVSEHTEKAGILWQTFRNRLGQTPEIIFPDSVATLIQTIPNLHLLSTPFSHDEIDNIVAHLPIDKAPGPDGFNGIFLKKCWPIIIGDFYKLFSDFHDGLISLEGLNECLITLIPKNPFSRISK